MAHPYPSIREEKIRGGGVVAVAAARCFGNLLRHAPPLGMDNRVDQIQWKRVGAWGYRFESQATPLPFSAVALHAARSMS